MDASIGFEDQACHVRSRRLPIDWVEESCMRTGAALEPRPRVVHPGTAAVVGTSAEPPAFFARTRPVSAPDAAFRGQGESRRPVVVQLVASASADGGPLKGLGLLVGSGLREKYDFRIVPMPWAPHGVSLRLLLEWGRRIRAEGPDLVHVRGLQSEGLYGILAARMAGCRRTVLSIHGFYGDCTHLSWLKRRLFNDVVEPLALSLATAAYCVCHYAENRPMVKRYARNLRGTIWNAAPRYDLDTRDARRECMRTRIGVSPDSVLVLSVGRLTFDKGYDVLMAAMDEVLAHDPNVRFAIVGDGPLRQEMVGAFDRDRVHIAGSQSDVTDYYLASDVFVTASRHENLSNALLEASEAALAIVATNVGGNPEVVVGGQSGTLVESEDAHSVAAAILAYVGDPVSRLEHGQAAQERARTLFDQESVYRQIDQVYSSLLS